MLSANIRCWCSGLCHFSRVQLFATPWTVAHQAPLSLGFSRQEHWSGLPRSPPGALPDPGIEPTSLVSPALAGQLFTTSATWEALETTDQTPKNQQTQWHSQRQGRTAFPSQEARGSETVAQVGPVPSIPAVPTSSHLYPCLPRQATVS